MKTSLILLSLFAATSTFGANFGTTSTPIKAATTATTTRPPTALAVSGPQISGGFRIVKPDGTTVIQQGTLSSNATSIATLNMKDTDAFLMSGGKCAFNVKYDEISGIAATNTTNRLYSNDTLIAQNTKIDLTAGTLKTIWTQPYLVPGLNNVRVMINADSATPSIGWIRINVAGTCGATKTTTEQPRNTSTPPAPHSQNEQNTKKPTTEVSPPPLVKFQPGSAEWNNLNLAFGYSNYGVTQLKGKGYSRYEELVKLNAAITAAINAKVVDQGAYNSLMTSWNSFVTDAAFKAAMTAIVPNMSGKK